MEKTPVAVIKSFNLIEIAWPGDAANRKLGLNLGTVIEVNIET